MPIRMYDPRNVRTNSRPIKTLGSRSLGQGNQINVTLDGVPASAVLVPDADATLLGNAASGFSLDKCRFGGTTR